MKNDANIMIVTQTRVQPDRDYEFGQWHKKIEDAVAQFPGYLSQEIHEPNPPKQLDWIIVQYFKTVDDAKVWLQSEERYKLLKEAVPLLVGIDNVYITQPGSHDRTTVTATISTKIAPAMEHAFLAWQLRIAPIQAKFPGFLGYKLERPRAGNDAWVAIVTFDSDEHLEAWLASSERKKLLKQLDALSIETHLEKVYSGFNFWFDSNKPQRSVWKENMLVLLTLYPVVFLLSFIQGPIVAGGVPFWFALFLSNLVSTMILGCVTTPWLMKKFQWWLKATARWQTILGTVVVLLLYAVSLYGSWLLSRM